MQKLKSKRLALQQSYLNILDSMVYSSLKKTKIRFSYNCIGLALFHEIVKIQLLSLAIGLFDNFVSVKKRFFKMISQKMYLCFPFGNKTKINDP